MKKLIILILVFILGIFIKLSFCNEIENFNEYQENRCQKECIAGWGLSNIGCGYICRGEKNVDECLDICEAIMYENYLRCLNCCDENVNNQNKGGE